jgi:hypothetical protein
VIDEWAHTEHVSRYLDRADEFPHRAEGENVLFEQVPLGLVASLILVRATVA